MVSMKASGIINKRTHSDKVQHDRPPLNRAFPCMQPEAWEIEKESEQEP